MKLRWPTAGIALPPEDRRLVERSIRLAIGRHAPRAREARVSVSRDEGDPGPGRVRCRIELRLRDGETLRVFDRGGDLRAALLAATWRLARRMERRDRIAGRPRRGARRPPAPRVSEGDAR